MTERQLRLLELIGTGEADCGAAGRLAVRAILAERDAYHEWAEKWLTRYYDSGYSRLILWEAMAELKAIHAKAKGGAQ